MISVIVPVFNVELYLHKCLDSILNQTYKELEIIVVDDGSTDNSGEICEEYRRKDERVKVFHTGNHGLSTARNFGLDNANGEYIGFVDSDDWIEPNMYELLFERAEETESDIVECGIFTDYKTSTIRQSAIDRTVANEEALEALLKEEILTQVWNKIYRRSIFNSVRFPDNRSFEDIATTYKLIQNVKVTGVTEFSYHYIQRRTSISQCHDKKNLIDNWLAHRQRYEDLKDCVSKEGKKRLLMYCSSAIVRTWVWYLKSEEFPEFIKEMSEFSIKSIPRSVYKDWPLSIQLGVFFARHNNSISFVLAYYLNQIYIKFKPKYYQ